MARWVRSCFGFFFVCLAVGVERGDAQDGTVKVNGDVYTNLGEDAMLKCRVETEELIVQVTWQKERHPQPENFLTKKPGDPPAFLNDFGRRVKFIGEEDTNGSIKIPNVTLSDESIYICIFTVYPSGPLEKKISLIVNVPPLPSMNPAPALLINTSESTIATCTAANSKPRGKISWQTSPFHHSVETRTSLHENGTETVQSELRMVPRKELNQLEVHCLVQHVSWTHPVQISYKISVLYPPSVRVLASKLNEDNLDLVCEADANPEATSFNWTKDDGPVPISVTLKEDHHLQVSKPNTEISGLYVCEASNEFGNDSGSLHLEIIQSYQRCYLAPAIIVPFIIGGLVMTIVLWFRWKRRSENWESQKTEIQEKQAYRVPDHKENDTQHV
ncbi:nectin-1 isoform X2 [Latimeria chalumnae]|uniref:nectin-1 isoform X2 n=1 Tax=Latimeria chalumnae TaxID=7897 RepID=UPI00313B4B20